MKIVLFVNDSLFSYLLAKPLIERRNGDIAAVVFSSRITGSLRRISDVYRKTHIRYFTYRSFIDMTGRIDRVLKRRTVQVLAEQYHLKTYRSPDVSTDPHLKALLPAEIGVTFNFDQILKKDLLAGFFMGVFNVHASRLPYDKGVSPVLWAFARGDARVWSTIYKMDEGIDTGAVYRRIELPVEAGETAFSLYGRVCRKSGESLAEQIEAVIAGTARPVDISSGDNGNYLGWPDKRHAAMMKTNRKKFIALPEVFRTLMTSD